jgi:hypothetical protein
MPLLMKTGRRSTKLTRGTGTTNKTLYSVSIKLIEKLKESNRQSSKTPILKLSKTEIPSLKAEKLDSRRERLL